MNNGSLIDQNEKLIELLKHSTTKLSAKKIDRFSNMIVMIQHKSERKQLVIKGNITINQLKENCLVINYSIVFIKQRLFGLKSMKTQLFYNGYEMKDSDLLSIYAIENATFLYMITEEVEVEM